jgi:hypothetical protein
MPAVVAHVLSRITSRYRAPDVLGGAMIDGGAAIPVEPPAEADGRPQPD